VYQARRAVKAILADGEPESAPSSAPIPALIEAVYTTPQLAAVGPVLELAKRSDLVVHRKSYAISMLSQVHGAHDRPSPDGGTDLPGEVKIWTDRNGTVLGAAAIGELAAELLASIQVTMQHGGTLEQLSAVPFAYPSISEVVTS
jgi:pyruvate/2-oxoglutarate dehydrogenase complex dihydrolipoamide dehydrogenase (E3) component